MTTNERKALGKGFGALLKAVDGPNSAKQGDRVIQIDIENIAKNPKQPRILINETKLRELSQSIRSKGVIQPILVRKKEWGETEYELIAGERRLRASKLAGFDKIPAVVRAVKDKDLLEVALIENIQRDDLNPIEESLAYKNLIEELGIKQEDLAKRVGKDRSTITNMLRLLNLPERIKDDLSNRTLSMGHARTLLSIDDPKKQLQIRNQIVENKHSVREVEQLVKQELAKTGKPKIKKKNESEIQQAVNQDRLRDLYQTKVSIRQKGKKGLIEFEYFDEDDFQRIYSMLMKKNGQP